MATAVLRPQDCHRSPIVSCGGLLTTPPRSKLHRNSNRTPTTTPNQSSRHSRGQSNRRKRSPTSSPPPPTSSLSPQAGSKSLTIGGVVKILKRGEQIPIQIQAEKVAAKADLVVSEAVEVSTLLNGSAVDGFYAGSGFFTSPPPSSLPLPVFLKKSCNQEATTDLCRILNLTL